MKPEQKLRILTAYDQAGYRLFERAAAVGDIRILRKDFPGWWFALGNHVLTVAMLRAALARRRPRIAR